MRVYTRQGDGGQTRLPEGEPIAKDAPVLEACGTLDELGAALGLARCESLPGELGPLVESIQRSLLQLNGELVYPPLSADPSRAIGPARVAALESLIDGYEARLAPLGEFVLPGAARAEAALHLARTVCRRAERQVVALARAESQRVTEHHLAYLNRLSDLLFVLARFVAR
ncbi:MAG: cob(I)yrinic acid a,c-diamide adenosyltransferase [Patescibacteria group bacterium]|nr:cob(I)yrinic acid a,c-diamide adenosyltransferase [Patescibacteria group bacterium]